MTQPGSGNVNNETDSLKRVDNLTITFVVDNCIEWMTKFPPGFTSEVKTHIAQQQSSIDPELGVPVLDFNDFCCGAHGFSALIETSVTNERTQTTLFDTGPDALSLPRNIKAMKIDPTRVDRVILSHWHSDHSGGLLAFLNLRRQAQDASSAGTRCTIDLHPNRPAARGISPPPFERVICALPRDPSFEEIERAGGVVEKHVEGHAVADGTVWVSGEIPRVTEYEGGVLGGRTWDPDSQKWFKDENIMDERYAVIDVYGKGLVIFSACSHAGIVNVVKSAVSQFSRPVYMIIGGLHLAGPELASRIPPTMDFLSKQLRPSPTYVLPMHCTGFNAKVALEDALGEGCVPAGVGIKVEVKGVRSDDTRLSGASF